MDFAIYMYFVTAYTGVTLVLGLLPPAEMRWWLLHPRALILVPVTGLLVSAPIMLLILTPFEIAFYLGILPENSILPGALVVWTAGTIWLRIDQYVQERGKWSTTKRWTRSAAAWPTAALARGRRLILRRRPMDAAGLSNWRARGKSDPAAIRGNGEGGAPATESPRPRGQG